MILPNFDDTAAQQSSVPLVFHESDRPDMIRVKRISEQSTGVLIEAIRMLNRRGEGPEAWVTSFLQDPIAFLIDTVSDPVRVRDARGQLLYQNPAANELPSELIPRTDVLIREHPYQCRRVEYATSGGALVIEVFSLER